jgi:exosortase
LGIPFAVSTAAKSDWLNRRNAIFALLMVLSLGLFASALISLFQTAVATDEYTHILLVLPLSLTLIFLEGRNLKASPSYAVRTGSVLILLAIGLWAGLEANHASIGADVLRAFMIFALVVFWLGSFIGCFGFRVFKGLLFPCLFLFFLVPVPGFVLDKIVVFLQQASTDATFRLFRLSGTPVMRDGFILSLPALQIEVAKQCSGIRSSEMLLITGFILAHLFLKRLWSQTLFVVLIVPMAIAKNAVRIFTLAMLGMHVNPDFLEGRLHHEGGGVFFALSLALLLAILWGLQTLENRMGKAKTDPALEAVARPA